MPASIDICGLFYEGCGIMRWLSEYLLSVTAAAIICMVAKSLVRSNSAAGQMIRIVTGVILIISIISPLHSVRFHSLQGYLEEFKASADDYVSAGAVSAQTAMNEIIIEETTAYILNAAKKHGVSLEVSVVLSDTSVPQVEKVILYGTVSPYQKSLLRSYIYENLGLTEEQVVWK